MNPRTPFLHRFMVDGGEYFYHSLTMELRDSSEGFPSREAENNLLQSYRRIAEEDNGVVMGTLFLTTRCPRDCGYCFLQGVPGCDMTTGEIDAALEIIGNGPADLLLYGGEPLLKPDLVRHTADRIKERGSETGLVLITGGFPVEGSLAELLASMDAFIIVSMDGPPDRNDSARPLKNGLKGSFEMAEKSFYSFREAGCRTGISMTLTTGNIPSARSDFLWLMERFEPDDMGLNPWLHPLEKGFPNPLQTGVEEALEAVTSCMEEALAEGMYVEQLARRARPFTGRVPRLKDCASAGGRLVVMPGGRAGTCDCMTCRGDHGASLEDIDGIKQLMNGFRRLSPVFFRNCIGCPAIAICGGGCRYDAYAISGDVRGNWPERCRFEVEFLRWMIEKTVREGRDSLAPKEGFQKKAMPMPVGTMLGEKK